MPSESTSYLDILQDISGHDLFHRTKTVPDPRPNDLFTRSPDRHRRSTTDRLEAILGAWANGRAAVRHPSSQFVPKEKQAVQMRFVFLKIGPRGVQHIILCFFFFGGGAVLFEIYLGLKSLSQNHPFSTCYHLLDLRGASPIPERRKR